MNQLIIDHLNSIQKIARKMTRDSFVEANDLLQDTCIKLIAKSERYTQRDGSHFLNFVKVVMTRTHMNMLRSHKIRIENNKSYTQYKSMTSRSYDLDDANLLYESVIKHLESEYELDVINMLIRGFLFREIAERYRSKAETIHGRHQKLRRRLKKILA